MDEAAALILNVLDEEGIINIGGKGQSVFNFVRESIPAIKGITLKEVKDVNMATDCSLNINKLNKILRYEN